ncbi:MAG: PilZ domain-containing protein [Deltaproteobacteria bacterium]|jgi:hypothetical protein
MSAEHRRHHRYAVELPIIVLEGRRATPALVRNVSFDGLLVSTRSPPTARKLLRLEVELPNLQEPLRLTAMAVHIVERDGGDHAVGIQLFGLDPATRHEWDRFIVDLRSGRTPFAVTEKPIETPKRAPPPEPKILDAGPAELRVLLDSSTSVEAVCAFIRNQDELMIRTDVRIGLGRDVWVTLVHPTTARTLSLPGRVRQQHAAVDFVGLSVLVSVDDSELAALESFEDEQISITIELDSVDLVGLGDVEGADAAPQRELPPGTVV